MPSEDIAKQLIAILEDESEVVDIRDDAGMDLADYDNNEVLEALIRIATDVDQPEILQVTCGEAIGEIWLKRKVFDEQIFNRLTAAAKSELTAYLKSQSEYPHKDYFP